MINKEAIDLGDDFYQKIGIDLDRILLHTELKTLIKNKFSRILCIHNSIKFEL